MKVIKYIFNGLPASMIYSKSNLKIAAKEADDGTYSIEDDGADEAYLTIWDELDAAYQKGVNSV